MNALKTAQRQASKKEKVRADSITAFWDFSANLDLLKESERLLQIKAGLSAQLFQAVRLTFDLKERSLETLLSASISTLRRRWRDQKPLDRTASERIDRIAVVCRLAEEVFESRVIAACWMSKPNKALGGEEPIMVCVTEIGGQQVRRVLQTLEWGGVI
ncbi:MULTISPECIES: antitoxin Xre/MbcA/ParS toxin-binding domain-containing protein [unclassified Pseudomonas]|uniref:antitoxin Xre/MbcA/ParS toxin-binding domain-containing protein n=1 Tax=unclassified Pseudomonas TaxID=196821 RepID=UPI001CC18D88|nr:MULTISPECIES: antitoxin Xre/MbcA/ParS toxin-binding domain-containing protein [unclassified Pseudomonas]